jgi:hypothetical protein
MIWRLPDTYHSAGHGRGTATLKFYEGRDILLYAVGCLIACVILAISEALAAWLSALIVGVALLAVAGAAALVGKSRLQKATPPVPKDAVGSVKADVDVIKERARR